MWFPILRKKIKVIRLWNERIKKIYKQCWFYLIIMIIYNSHSLLAIVSSDIRGIFKTILPNKNVNVGIE